MGFLKPVSDGYLLWASFLALFTLDALVSALFFCKSTRSLPLVTGPPHPKVTIYYRLVVHLEDARDFDAVITGLAVSTGGAGDWARTLVSLPDFIYQCQLIGGENAWSGTVGDGDIFYYLLHRGPAI